VINSEQYLTLDRLSELYANNTLRITSRQSIQFHGVLKKKLARTIKEINESLLTTLAACGDVARNVMASPKPDNRPVLDQVFKDTLKLYKSLLPATPVYHDIWIDGKQIELNEPNYSNFVDPIYGKGYLPRKFKTAFAIPPLNDIDIFTNCLGFIAITENDKLIGYNFLAGGGMGKTHNNNKTFPRLADVVGYFPSEYIEDVARAALIVFRDYGDRTNRKHARLKYLLAEKGVEWFKKEVEKLTGFQFEPPKPFKFTHQQDSFGWHKQSENKWFLGVHVETGRIKDSAIKQYKSALKKMPQSFPHNSGSQHQTTYILQTLRKRIKTKSQVF
jgi:sulfite reductase (NADPH) hemoprotein beta-component